MDRQFSDPIPLLSFLFLFLLPFKNNGDFFLHIQTPLPPSILDQINFFHCGHRHLLLLLLLLLLHILLPIPTALWMMLERNECNPHIILLLPLSSPFALGNRLEKEQWRCNGFWSLSLESCVEHIAHNEKKNCIGRESNPGRPRSAWFIEWQASILPLNHRCFWLSGCTGRHM